MRRILTIALLTLTMAACGGEPREAPPPPRAVTPDDVAEARAYLENQTPLPRGWSFETIPFAEDGHLRIGHAAPEEPRATILYVPGYTSSPELASDFLTRWHDLGFEVASVDLPGQGGSMRREDDRQKTYTGDFHFYGQAVAAAAEHVADIRRSSGPFIVAGDSFGAHSLLRAASDGGLPEADGLFPLVPALAFDLDGVPKPIVKFMVGMKIRSGGGADYMDGNGPWDPDSRLAYDWTRCGDREDRNYKNWALYVLQPELRVGGISNEYGLGMVRSGEELVKDVRLRKFDRPVTMLTAGKDVIVKNAPAEALCSRRMPSCQLVQVPEATHCLYLEDDPTQEKVHDALLGLLGRIEERA